MFFVDPCVRVYACLLKYVPLPKTKPCSQTAPAPNPPLPCLEVGLTALITDEEAEA